MYRFRRIHALHRRNFIEWLAVCQLADDLHRLTVAVGHRRGCQGLDPVEGFAVLFSFVHTAIEVRLPWLWQRRSDVLWISKEYLCLEVLHDLVCALFSNAFDLHANVSVESDLDEFALLLVKQESDSRP